MPDPNAPMSLEFLEEIDQVPAADWDALLRSRDPSGNPFVCHDFLLAAEASGCARRETGWLPRHAVLRDAAGRIVAAAPMYLKSHSYAEYIFDWAWADAYERAGGNYYPKLLAAAPFSPVTGPRLLCPAEEASLTGTFLRGLAEAVESMGVSSLHINFATRAEWEMAGRCGYLLREGRQFHWHNRGYADFDDFLSRLTSRKRKTLRKERARATENGIVIRRLTGRDIRPEHWDAFYDFYLDTAARKWGHPYLNRAFFEEIGARLAERILLVMAFRDDKPIAGALNLYSDDAIFGRNWGCAEDHPMLHFECCYYQAMEFAIEKGLKRVEAGAGGHHKISRGYVPEPTYSAHWIANAAFRDAVARFLESERREVGMERVILAGRAPFRSDGAPPPPAPRSEEEEEGF